MLTLFAADVVSLSCTAQMTFVSSNSVSFGTKDWTISG